jgi:transposase-like protein
MEHPKTLTEAIRFYADQANCVAVVKEMRWGGDEPTCPHCKGQRHYWLAKQMRWKCAKCRKQFTAKTGTVFEDSPIPLDKWLIGIWLVSNCKNGVSSYEIARDLGITQKSAWFMLHRIRYALQNGSLDKFGGPESGPIEVDETFFGPKPQKMHRDKRLALKKALFAGSKATVMGMLDRDSRQVRAKVIPDVKRETLQAEILKQIEKGSTVYTDCGVGYDSLAAREYIHETVNHTKEYVRGQVSTQGLENFWSLLKRGLTGTYVAVEPFHLDAYVDEQVFRYNNRATKDNPLTDYDRFMLALSQISGKRLTYAELTGKVGETGAEPF